MTGNRAADLEEDAADIEALELDASGSCDGSAKVLDTEPPVNTR